MDSEKNSSVPHHIRERRKKHPRSHEPWDIKERRTLRDEFLNRKTIPSISKLLGRSEVAIICQLETLGFDPDDRKDHFANLSDSYKQTLSSLAKEVAAEEAEIKEMERRLAQKKLTLSANRQKLYNLLAEENVKNISLPSGAIIIAEVRTTYSMKKGLQRELIYKWLSENGMAEIIKPYVHNVTFNKRTRLFVESGGCLDEDLIAVTTKKTAKVLF